MDIEERPESDAEEGYGVAILDRQSIDPELANTENNRTPPGGTNTNQTRCRPSLALALILGAAALERVSFYSIQANFQNILDFNSTKPNVNSTKHTSFTDGTIQVAWVVGAGHFFTLVGAWLGENKIGVYRSLVIGLILELLACLLFLPLLPELLIDEQDRSIYVAGGDKTSVVFSCILLTMGLALTRTNMMVLAVQQIPEENIIKNCFFLWFFWFIDFGTAGGYAMTAIQVEYVIVAILPVPVLLATVLILILPCFVNGLCVRPRTHAFGVLYRSIRHEMPSVCKLRISTDIFNRLPESVQQNIVQCENDMERLFVHIRSIALFTALHIVFEGLYGIQTIWTVQIISDWNGSNGDYSWIANLYDPGSVLIITPFVHFILRRYWPQGLRQLRLMGCAMLLMSLSCVSAAILETFEPKRGNPYNDLIYEIPQFIFLGLAEIFTYAITYEFIYMETPNGLRNTMLGLYFCSRGLGMFLCNIILAVIEKSDLMCIYDPDGWSVAHFLLVLAALQLLVLAGYIVLARKYKYRDQYERSVSAAIDVRRVDFGAENSSVSSSDSDGEKQFLLHPGV